MFIGILNENINNDDWISKFMLITCTSLYIPLIPWNTSTVIVPMYMVYVNDGAYCLMTSLIETLVHS